MGSQNCVNSILGVTSSISSTTYTLTQSDSIVNVNSFSSPTLITLPLPTANQNGRIVTIKDSGNASIYTITILPASGTLLDGATSAVVIVKNYGSLQLFCDGTNYYTQGLNKSYINIRTFSASGTYTPTIGMAYAIVECVGGGGGGGGVSYTNSNGYSSVGAGGGAGAYISFVATASQVGSSQAIVVGIGGAGVAASSGNGGGTTQFGSLATATGGSGGGTNLINSSSGVQPSGGAGGTATSSGVTTMLILPGQQGQNGFVDPSTNLAFPGAGGSTILGAGGVMPGGYLVLAGNPGSGYGSGGSGADEGPASSHVNGAGGNGANGIVIITEFLS
jgi:hypothetical protein